MKHTPLFEAIAKLVKPYVDKMEYVCTINPSEKHVKYPIEKQQCGIYAFYPKGEIGQPFYVGETLSCMLKRISNHKRSLREPSWPTEITGKKFDAYGIERVQDLDVYFIPYDELISKYDSRTLEGLFKLVLKPMVFE